MGKKRSRASQTSKGLVNKNPNSDSKRVQKALRREYRGSTAELNNKMKAHLKLKNVMLTVPNPNTNETNKRFIRVSSREVWGSSKR
jgi:hypothetical protein